MRRIYFVWLVLPVFMAFMGCSKSETDVNAIDKTLPVQVVIDIPTAISDAGALKSYTTENDTINGSDIYRQLRVFIGVGEKSAEMIQDLFNALRLHKINKPMSFTYISNDDQRTKQCVVVENAVYDGKYYELKLTITDESNKALQIFWNSNPVEGVAILNPYWINNKELVKTAMYKIEFGRADGYAYDCHMTISITGLPVIGVYGMDKLKMFVGKKGNLVEMFGNSNHPNALLFDATNKDGFSYAFAIRADSTSNIAIAKLALPGTSITSNDSIFEKYAFSKIYTNEMHKIWDPIADTPEKKIQLNAVISQLATKAQIPAYFNSNGYMSCGKTLPTGFSPDFANFGTLLPYAPSTIKNMTIGFAN